MTFSKSELIKLISLLVILVGCYYTIVARITAIEKDIQRHDIDELVLEFVVLQERISNQNQNLTELMKATNFIINDIQELQIAVVRNQ